MNSVDNHGVRVFGLGGPHGDDQIGWKVAERLQATPELASVVFSLRSPSELIAHLQSSHVRRVLLLDACETESWAKGTVMVLGEANLLGVEPEITPMRWSSANDDTTVADTLALARSLGAAWEQLVVCAAIIGPRSEQQNPSEAALAVVPAFEEQVRSLLRTWGVLQTA